jgi:TRAP-type transport system periplasmic protein
MRRSRPHWFMGGVGLVALLVALAAGCGQATPAPSGGQQSGTSQAALPQVNWVFQTSETTINNPFSVEYVEMTRQIGAKTNGKFNVRLLVAKEIGIDRSEFPQALAKGTIDSAWLYTSEMSGVYPFLGVFDLPYLTTDQTSVFKVDEAVRPMYDEATKSAGYIAIPNGMFAWFPQDILMRDPIPNLADLKGIKIRTWRAADSELIKALGGEPVSMPIAEAYTAMQRGVMSGLNTGPQAMLENSMYESAKYYYSVRLEPGGAWPSVNKAKWDALPADYQKVFQEEVVAATKRIRDKYDKEVDKQKQALADKGVKINEPSKTDIDAWRKAAQTYWGQWAAKDPKNKQALDLANKAIGLQ